MLQSPVTARKKTQFNVRGFFLPSDHLLTQCRQRKNKVGSAVSRHISLRLVWYNLKCIMFAYGYNSGVIEDADRLEYDYFEEDI